MGKPGKCGKGMKGTLCKDDMSERMFEEKLERTECVRIKCMEEYIHEEKEMGKSASSKLIYKVSVRKDTISYAHLARMICLKECLRRKLRKRIECVRMKYKEEYRA